MRVYKGAGNQTDWNLAAFILQVRCCFCHNRHFVSSHELPVCLYTDLRFRKASFADSPTSINLAALLVLCKGSYKDSCDIRVSGSPASWWEPPEATLAGNSARAMAFSNGTLQESHETDNRFSNRHKDTENDQTKHGQGPAWFTLDDAN